MRLDLTEDQQAFQEAVNRFIATEVPLLTVRDLYENRLGFEPEWWQQAAQLGWTSLFVPEAYGGGSLSGSQTCDAVILAEEIGRGLAPGPFCPVNLVAAGVGASSNAAQHAGLLGRLVSGEVIAVWAFAEKAGRWTTDAVQATLTPVGPAQGGLATQSAQGGHQNGGSFVLNGTKHYVEAANAASHALVTARAENGGLSQVMVALDSPGVSVKGGRSVDMTRRFGTISFTDVAVDASALVGTAGDVTEAVNRQLQLAVSLQCAEMVGIADRTLEFTLEYGQDRYAFGRPIVSFQALKHRIADMAQWLEACKAVSDELASVLDTQTQDASNVSSPEAQRLAHVAKSYVGEKTTRIVEDCVQITGGIGVTWEHDIHMYNRRVVLDRALYGSPEEHKDELYMLLDSTVENIENITVGTVGAA